MTLELFKQAFNQSLNENPLPNENEWILQPLQNASIRNNHDWFEVLYRTTGCYQCNNRHFWTSSWAMVLFRFKFNGAQGFGRVRMKRFGQRCNKCPDDDTYHVGFCDNTEVWYIIQCLLVHIMQRCYEKRHWEDLDVLERIIFVSNVRPGKFGGMGHQKEFCEACAYDRCQEMYQRLRKKK